MKIRVELGTTNGVFISDSEEATEEQIEDVKEAIKEIGSYEFFKLQIEGWEVIFNPSHIVYAKVITEAS